MFWIVVVSVVIGVVVLGTVYLAWEFRNAPLGYEDETGFHLLEEKFPDSRP